MSVSSEIFNQCEVIFEFDRRPFMNSTNYTINPSLQDLQTRPLHSLKSVSNFSVEGHYGKLEWQDSVDLLDLNIDKTIRIQDQQIEVYPETEFSKSDEKPSIGQGINGKCKITFKNASSVLRKIQQDPLSMKTIVKAIEKQCQMQQVQFIGFDETNLTWSILVDHFSGYGFDLDEEDEEGNNNNNNTHIPPPKQTSPFQNLPPSSFQIQGFDPNSIVPQIANLPPPTSLHRGFSESAKNRNRLASQDILLAQQKGPVESRQLFGGNQQQQYPRGQQEFIPQIQRNQPIFQQQMNQQNMMINDSEIIPEEAEFGSSKKGIENSSFGEELNMSQNSKSSNILHNINRSYDSMQRDQQQQPIQNNLNDFPSQPFFNQGKNTIEITQKTQQQQFKQQHVDLKGGNLFKNIVENRKKLISEQENAHSSNKTNVSILKSLRTHDKVVQGIQMLNQVAYDHPMKEFSSKQKKFYADFAFSPSWNANGFSDFNPRSNILSHRTFAQKFMGRVKVNNKESYEKYNRVVITGFLDSLVECQKEEFFTTLKELSNQVKVVDFDGSAFAKSENFKKNLPKIIIPTHNDFSIFLVIYLRNHLVPALSQAFSSPLTHDLACALHDELTIFILINILFGNPQLDMISLAVKIRSNRHFPEQFWENMKKSLLSQQLDHEKKDQVKENMILKQMKRFFNLKFSNPINEQPTNPTSLRQEEFENQIMQHLKRNELQSAIKIASDLNQPNLALLLSTFEMGGIDLHRINQSHFIEFPRVLALLSGDLSEIYQDNRLPKFQKLACELWYGKNQRKSFAQIFDSFLAKLKDNVLASNKGDVSHPLEFLLIGLYAQNELKQQNSSKKLCDIQLFVQISPLCYSENQTDRRLGWFIVEMMNSIFIDDKLLINKRARQMRGFLEQLNQLDRQHLQLIVLLSMSSILNEKQLTWNIKDLFVRSIPTLKQSASTQSLSWASPDKVSNYLQAGGAQPQSGLNRLLATFSIIFFNESQGLRCYSKHQYAAALEHLVKSSIHVDICNTIIAYHEGPRVFLFGQENDRDNMKKHINSVSQLAGIIPRYKFETGLIAQAYELLLPEQEVDLSNSEVIKSLLNFKDTLIQAKDILSRVSGSNVYTYLDEGNGVHLPCNNNDRALVRKNDNAIMRVQTGGIIFQEFVDFVFEQLGAQVGSIRKYTSHFQNSNDINHLFQILAQSRRTPQNHFIQDLILSTL